MSGEDESSGWQLTESDPGVFTELLKSLQVPLVVDDLYSLDPSALAALAPLRALIFLFKYVSPTASSTTSNAGQPDPDFPGFFAHQTVQNACATLAVLNALGNIHPLPCTSVTGEETPLQQLLSFTAALDPSSRGLALTSADWLREAHNALSPPSPLSLAGLYDPKDQEKEDAYHFVVYIPVAGQVYELDGLRQHAVAHGGWSEGAGEGWVGKAAEVVRQRIETYPAGALEFSLLALRDDPLPALQAAGESKVMELANESAKRERWAFENSLRRHNHLGLVHALVHALAKARQLSKASEGAREKMRERVRKRQEGGAAAMEE